MVDRHVLATTGSTATAHFDVPHCWISRTASSTSRVDATIAVLSRVGALPAEVVGVAVIGADHADLEVDVGQADDAHPDRRHQEVRVGALLVHVRDAVLGLVVLHARRAAACVPIQCVPRPVNVSCGPASPRMRR